METIGSSIHYKDSGHPVYTEVPWIDKGVGNLTLHNEILQKIADLRDQSKSIPLHYKLYDLLSQNNGKFPPECISKDTFAQQRAELIEKMVPDIAVNIHKLERAGYEVIHDPVNQIEDAGEVAEGMKQVVIYAWLSDIDSKRNPTYDEHGNLNSVYPLRGKLLEKKNFLLEKIQSGAQDTFAVKKDGQIIATFCSVKSTNAYGRSPIVELGRTATDYRWLPILKGEESNGDGIRHEKLSLRGVAQLRLLHMLVNTDYNLFSGKQLDYIYSDIRIMGRERWTSDGKTLLVPDARSVQGVFFGGINHEQNSIDLGFGIWGTGWQYVMGDKKDGSGGCEPFLRIGQYLDEERFSRILRERTFWLPSEAEMSAVSSFLSSMMKEHDEMDIRPMDDLVPADTNIDPWVILNPGISTAYTSIDFINITTEAEKNIADNIPDEAVERIMPLSDALHLIQCQEGVIDHDVPYIEAYCECTMPQGEETYEDLHRMNSVMHKLLELGFTVTGITPSDKTDGIRVTFSLITKFGLEKGLEPYKLPAGYYKKNRTTRAIKVTEEILPILEERSINAAFNRSY